MTGMNTALPTAPADFEVPLFPHRRAGQSELDHKLDEIRIIMKLAGSNRHAQITVAILALIANGINTFASLRWNLGLLGFNAKHAAIILHKSAGKSPVGSHWWKDADGLFHAHPDDNEHPGLQ